MFGAASTGTARIPDLSFEGTLSRLCTQPGLAAAVATAPDRRATLGVVSLRHLAGHGAVWQAPDGSLAAVHGHVRVPVASRNTAAWLLESYRRDQQSLERLEGSYAIALWDAGDGSLVLTNDRFGLRNVYYTVVGAAVRFAPTVGALLPIAPRPRADLQGVADFLAFEHLLGDRTLVEGIRALPPATIARFRGDGVDLRRYWCPRYQAQGASLTDCADELGRLLAAAVERAFATLDRVGLPLSGGLDSRALLAVARGAVPPPITCVTYGIPGCDDLALAARLVDRGGERHHVLELRPGFIAGRASEVARLTDGMHLALNVHAAALQQCARWCDVIVLGNGGDCLLDRLWWWPDDAADEDDYVERMYRRINGVLSPHVARELLSPALLEEFTQGPRRRLRERLACYRGPTAADAADAFNVGDRHWRWVLQGVPAQATHVDFREPFYDYRIADFAQTVPASLRARRQLHAELIRRRAPELASVPLQGGGRVSTSPLANRLRSYRKRARRAARRLRSAIVGPVPAPQLHGFADYDLELRGPSRSLLEQVVLSPRALDRGWYRPERVRQLAEDHVTGRRNHARLLGVIATLELWLQEFVDGA